MYKNARRNAAYIAKSDAKTARAPYPEKQKRHQCVNVTFICSSFAQFGASIVYTSHIDHAARCGAIIISVGVQVLYFLCGAPWNKQLSIVFESTFQFSVFADYMSRIIAARLLARLTNMPRALLLWIADSSRQDVAHQKHCVCVCLLMRLCTIPHAIYTRMRPPFVRIVIGQMFPLARICFEARTTRQTRDGNGAKPYIYV